MRYHIQQARKRFATLSLQALLDMESIAAGPLSPLRLPEKLCSRRAHHHHAFSGGASLASYKRNSKPERHKVQPGCTNPCAHRCTARIFEVQPPSISSLSEDSAETLLKQIDLHGQLPPHLCRGSVVQPGGPSLHPDGWHNWANFVSVTVRAWNGSSGSGFRFRRFLLEKGFLHISVQFKGMARFWFRFLKKTVPMVPVSDPGKTVPTVPVSSSGLVPS